MIEIIATIISVLFLIVIPIYDVIQIDKAKKKEDKKDDSTTRNNK